jgi:hypothetical protein
MKRSENLIKVIIAFVIGLGVLGLGAIGMYAYLEYFRGPESTRVPAAGATSIDQTNPRATKVESQAISTPSVTLQAMASASHTAIQTQDFAATATAGCAAFSDLFPGTPCPEQAIPGIEATATQACEVFLQRFPGTPCP